MLKYNFLKKSGVYAETSAVIVGWEIHIGMPVKHTPTGVVHSGAKGGKTGCGTNTNVLPDHWVNTSSNVTCDKNGCKN